MSVENDIPRREHLFDSYEWCMSRGLSIIPLDIHKAPLGTWKEFRERRCTDHEVQNWYLAGAHRKHKSGPQEGSTTLETVWNWGVVCGPLSGVVVVDSDSATGDEWCAKHLPETPWMVKTSKGCHRYYRHPGEDIDNQSRNDREPKIDVRGNRGQVAAPLSVHKSGAIYTPFGDWTQTQADLPVYDRAWMYPIFPNSRPVAPETAALTETRRVLLSDVPDNAAERYARAFVRTRDVVTAGRRHKQAYYVAAALRKGFALTTYDALRYLQEWNATKANPPLPLEDLPKIVKDAEKAREAYGSRLVSRERAEIYTTTQGRNHVRFGKR